MSRLFHSTRLVASASMAIALLVSPTAAYANGTTTKLTKTEMMSALNKVTTTTKAAAKAGWRAKTATAGDITRTFVVDPIGGLAFEQWSVSGYTGNEYTAQDKGTYTYLSDSASLAAVKVMARPSVRYAYDALKSQPMPDIVEDTALGALVDVLAAQDHSGTKTVYDDGSTDYTVKTDGASVTLHVAAAGTLTSMKTDGTELKVALAYAYGAQKITLPAASVTVDRATLNKAKVYVAMAADVKTAATNGAAHTRTAAKSKTVKVASLRQIVRKDVTTVNQGVCLTMIKAINVEDGVKVYATNPWTHQSVAYTVKASGKEVFVTKV